VIVINIWVNYDAPNRSYLDIIIENFKMRRIGEKKSVEAETDSFINETT